MASEQAAQQLCRSCGLCCNGTLFSRTPLPSLREQAHFLEAPTQVAVRRLPVATVAAEGTVEGVQPCGHWLDGACEIYLHRPDACAGFRCLLLRQVTADTTSLTRALELVGETQTRLEQLAQAAGMGDANGFPEGFHAWSQAVAHGQSALSPPLRLKLGALVVWLRQHFYLDEKP